MIVTLAKWSTIRHLFTEEEKAKVNAANIGETVCPRGIVVDEAQLSAEIIAKLK